MSSLALDGNGTIAVVAVIVALWLASLGAVWKIATILNAISDELKSLKSQTETNAENLALLQQRFNIPQASHPTHAEPQHT